MSKDKPVIPSVPLCKPSKQLVEQTIMLLLHEGHKAKYRGKRFYGAFLNNMRRYYNTPGIETAAVNVTDQLNLHINLNFFACLTEQQRVEVLEHEVFHIISYHLKRFKGCTQEDAYLWNLACDAAINEPLTSLHEFGITQKKLAKEIKNLKMGETAEYYYKMIRNFRNENGGKGGKGDKQLEKAGGNFDDHGQWDKSNANGEEGEEDNGGNVQNEELIKEVIKKNMNKAVEQAGGRGVVPMDVLQAMDRLGKSTVNWKQQLRRFFARADTFSKESTRRKLNRRYRHLQPGKRKKPCAHVAFAIDESGSVSNTAFAQVFNELDKIVENGVKVTVIHADCQINRVYEYKAKMKIERTGMGGTAYMPAIEKAKELKCDGMIYFGDGDNFGEELFKPKMPFLWAMINENKPPAKWGGVCRVKVEDERW